MKRSKIYFSRHYRRPSSPPQVKKLAKLEHKADRAAYQADRALEKFEAKISKRQYYRIHNSASLDGKLPHRVISRAVIHSTHQEINQNEEDNLGLQAVHKTEQTAETSARAVHSHQQHSYLKARHKVEKAERKLDRANVKVLQQQQKQTQSKSSNPISRWQQKRRIKKEYQANRKAGRMVSSTLRPTRTQKVSAWIKSRSKAALLLIAGAYGVGLIVSCFSSCAMMFQSTTASAGVGVYPSSDEDILAAEETYLAMEQELQDSLDTYEEDHDYDEYHYELDEIGHDPYVLISLVTAYHQDIWTLEDATDTLEMLFEKQYILTEDVVVERRFRTEEITWTDGEGNVHTETQRVYYDYSICTVTLDNFDLSFLPMYVLGAEQLELYSVYMATLGGRPELFPDSAYVDKYITNPPTDYDVPQEYLENDPTFAAILREAEKYLGYPYVWGGASPSTSFDCSGYVSWVINHSGWNVGRLGVLQLQDLCTPVSAAQAKPGDLVFFENTYDAPLPGPTHIGIYVGDNMFIHCGDPISYASLDEPYWQQHFHSFGKLYG